jgi:hypothetical protein
MRVLLRVAVWVGGLTAGLAALSTAAPPEPPKRGPVQACQFLQVNADVVPEWADSLAVVKRELGTVPGTDPVVLIQTLTVRNGCARTVYFDGVSPGTPALWTPVQDESNWRLLSLSCLSGRRAHTLAPGAELRFSYSTVEEEAEKLVIGLILSIEGEKGWAVFSPRAESEHFQVASAHPSSQDRLQTGRSN